MTATINDCSPGIGRQAVLPVWSADGGVVYGRDAERRAVGELLRRAQRGAGGVVLVEGEQGIGKSRLLGESVSEAAGQGFSLAAGAADRLGPTIPFFASRAALRADLEQRAAVAPVLVSLDDLQWARPAMLAALRSLPGELKGHPVAWILARSSAQHETRDCCSACWSGTAPPGSPWARSVATRWRVCSPTRSARRPARTCWP